MAERNPETIAAHKSNKGFSDEERAAMKERAKELKAEARANKSRAAGEQEVLTKIAEMSEPDRAIAERLHQIITASVPELLPKNWYGQPAYAWDGKIICFFRGGKVDGVRYLTLGFSDTAHLDHGTMWPTSFALTGLTDGDEAMIGALVKKAVG